MQGGMRMRRSGGQAARYAIGVTPWIRRNAVVNDPTLDHPTVMQISATLRSVVVSSEAARSMRRVIWYWCGVGTAVRSPSGADLLDGSAVGQRRVVSPVTTVASSRPTEAP